MRNVTVKHTVQVECNLTPDQWQLYDKPGRSLAATSLNASFADAVNAGKNIREVRKAMDLAMRDWSPLGANDTEGRATVEDLIEVAFGKGAR